MPWYYVSANGNDRNGRPVTYRHIGPTLDFYQLWTWIEDNLGRHINHMTNLHTLVPFVHYQTILRWRHSGIRIATARKIATHFGVTPTDIWGPDWAKGTHL